MWFLNFKKQKLNLGQQGEQWAQQEYKKRSYKIFGQNVFNRKGKQLGEIDFIAVNKTNIVFVEVKTRVKAKDKFGSAVEAVDVFKQQKILRAVKLFLQSNKGLSGLVPRIDVCLVEVEDVDKSQYCVKIILNAVEDEN
jgi:uncharacterized protein (TIGR00252 family)